MRLSKPGLKTEKTVEIPTELIEFLTLVQGEIEQKSEEATIESDDLLQNECAYGGLVDASTSVYQFTYFPNGETKSQWTFLLTSEEIYQIALNIRKTLTGWACKDVSCESLFSRMDDDCFLCDYADAEPIIPHESFLSNKILWGQKFFELNPGAKAFHLKEVVENSPYLLGILGNYSSEDFSAIMRG